MLRKGLQNKLLVALFLFNIGTVTYAISPLEQLESIGLSTQFLEEEVVDDFRRSNKIQLGAFKTHKKVIKQKNLSKKFGPLLIGCNVRSINRTAIGFNIDVLEAMDILAQKDPSLFLKTDGEHFILSPQTKEEVLRTINMFKSKFKNSDAITQKTVSAQLI
jgi:hypothetical protein